SETPLGLHDQAARPLSDLVAPRRFAYPLRGPGHAAHFRALAEGDPRMRSLPTSSPSKPRRVVPDSLGLQESPLRSPGVSQDAHEHTPLDLQSMQRTGLAVILLDLDGRVIDWSQEATAMTGLQATEVQGEHVSFLRTSGDAGATLTREELDQALAYGRYEAE